MTYKAAKTLSGPKKAVAFIVRENGFYQPILECGHKYRLIKELRMDRFSCSYCEHYALPRREQLLFYRKWDKRPRKYYSKVGHPVEQK